MRTWELLAIVFVIGSGVYSCVDGAAGEPAVLWHRTFGGPEVDSGSSIQQTRDGGYVVAGDTWSFAAGVTDMYLVKTDENGSQSWARTFGGSSFENCRSVRQTRDGGYIMTGETGSLGEGELDVYLVKTDSLGTEEWSRTFGTGGFDYGGAVRQTDDDGYIIAAWMAAGAGDGQDAYLIKTDDRGREVWSKTYGEEGNGQLVSVQQTDDDGDGERDDGFIAVGRFLVKTDRDGNEVWSTSVFGSSVQQTTDGGYIVAGAALVGGADDADVHLVKTDADGNTVWRQNFGGEKLDAGNSVWQTSDGGYIIAGITESYGAGDWDVYIVKTDENGHEAWSKTLGTEVRDWGADVQQTTDGGYAIGGAIGGDAFLVKLGPDVPAVRFVRGDTTSDGRLNIADAVCVLTYLFGADGETCTEGVANCLDGADTNDDGQVNVADAVFVLQYLFVNGPVIPGPYPACGRDPTGDEVACADYPPCQD